MRRSDSVQHWRLFGIVSLAGIIFSTLTLGSISSFFGASSSASAAQSIPYKINFQGRLTDNSGNILPNGTYNVKFKIYDAATAGTLLYSEDRVAGTPDNRITVTNGLFSIQFGDVSSLSPSIFNSSSPRFLEVELPTPATATSTTPSFTEGPMTPRQPLGASAYAFNSDTLDGIDGASFARNDTANTFAGNTQLFKNAVNSTTSFQIQNAAATTTLFNADTTNGRIGIGTSAPSVALDVVGEIKSNTQLTVGTNTSLSTTALTIGGTSLCTSSGCTAASGSGSYIQNQTASPQAASFSISGTGLIKTATNSSQAFSVQDNLGNVAFNVNTSNESVGFGANAVGTAKLYATSGSKVIARFNTTGTNDLLELQKSGINVVSVSSNGNTVFKNASDSTTSFEVKNAASTSILGVDTTYDSTNLITNGGIEADAVGWNARSGTLNVGRSTAQKYHGNASLQLDSDVAGEGVNYPITLTAGVTYKIIVHAKNTTSSTSSFAFGYSHDGVDETTYIDPTNTTSPSGWRRHTLVFTPSTVSGTPYIFFKTTSATSRSFFIDGISLRTNTQSAPYREGTHQFGGVVTSPFSHMSNEDSDTAFGIYRSSGDRLFNADAINSSINIGDTTATSGKLTVYNSSSSLIALNVEQYAANQIASFTDSGTTVFSMADEGATLFQNKTNSTSAFQIQNAAGVSLLNADTINGRIGVGTAAPAARLHVASAGDAGTTNPTTLLLHNTTSQGSSQIIFEEGTLGTGEFKILYNSSADGLQNGLEFINNNGTVVTRMNRNTGNVSIGNVNDTYKLDVTGDINNSAGYRIGGDLIIRPIANNSFFVGHNTGNGSVTGSFNIGFGRSVLQSLTTGSDNTAIGLDVLGANQTGTGNVGVGGAALQQNTGSTNTAVGRLAMQSNTSGGNNVALGNAALKKNITGSFNTAIGTSAGNEITGSNNTFVGYKAGDNDPSATSFFTVANLQNAGSIGYGSQVQQSNSLVLGGQGANQVNVGIGTTMPTNVLSVSPVATYAGTAGTGGVASTTVTGVGTSFTSDMIGSEIIFANGNASTTPVKAKITAVASATSLTVDTSITVADGTAFRIHHAGLQVASSGKVGIGTVTPEHSLDIRTADGTILLQDTGHANQWLMDATDGGILQYHLKNASDTTNAIVQIQSGVGGASTASSILGLREADGAGQEYGANLAYDGGANQFQLQTVQGGTTAAVLSVDRSDGKVKFKNTANSTTAFQIQNAADTSNLFVADTLNSKIGIGKIPTSTGLKLEIESSSASGKGEGLKVKNTTAAGYGEVNVTNDNNSYGSLITWGSAHGYALYRNNTSLYAKNSLYLTTDGDVANGGTSAIHFMTGGYDPSSQIRMTIGSSGNVGIGMDPTTYKLDVGGALRVTNGTTPALTVDTTIGNSTLRSATTASDAATEGANSFGGFGTATGWTIGGSGSTSTATHTNGGGTTAIAASPAISTTWGSVYKLVYTVGSRTSGNVYATISEYTDEARWANGTFTVYFTAGNAANLTFVPSNDFNGTISDVSVQAVVKSNSTLNVQNSSGTTALEVRASGTTSNLFIGLQAGSHNINGTSNAAVGTAALSNNTTGGSNAAFGHNALQRNTTGGSNTALGSSALTNNTSGAGNTAIGANALISNTTGVSSVAIGQSTLFSSTTGRENVAIGSNSLDSNTTGSYNSAIGRDAMTDNTTGGRNVALGHTALRSNTTGWNNIAIGSNAGYQDPSATNFYTLNNLQNAAAIGYGSQVQASNSLVLGGQGANAVNVGIGTTIPTNTLSVSPMQYNAGTAGTGGVASTTVTGSGTTWDATMVGSEIIFANGSASTTPVKAIITAVGSATSLTVGTSITVASGTAYRIHYPGLQVTSTGNVGIGLLSPVAKFDVGGEIRSSRTRGGSISGSLTIQGTTGNILTVTQDNGEPVTNFANISGVSRFSIDNAGNVGIGATALDKLHVGGDARVGTGTSGCVKDADATVIAGTCSSDERLKKNIQTAADVLSRFEQIRVVNYNWRGDEFPEYGFGTEKETGVIAQELENLFPDLVKTDDRGYKAVNYTGLSILNIKATTEVSAKLSDLQDQHSALQQKLDTRILNVSGAARIASLAVTGNAEVTGDLTVKGITRVADIEIGGHIITTGTAPASIVLASAGDAATVAVEGNDTSGTITITTGSTGVSEGDVARVTFAKKFGKTPRIILTGDDAISTKVQPYVSTKSPEDFAVSSVAGFASNTTYRFVYYIVE